MNLGYVAIMFMHRHVSLPLVRKSDTSGTN